MICLSKTFITFTDITLPIQHWKKLATLYLIFAPFLGVKASPVVVFVEHPWKIHSDILLTYDF